MRISSGGGRRGVWRLRPGGWSMVGWGFGSMIDWSVEGAVFWGGGVDGGD